MEGNKLYGAVRGETEPTKIDAVSYTLTPSLHRFIVKKQKGDNIMGGRKRYDKEYKVQAVKLGRKIGFSNSRQWKD